MRLAQVGCVGRLLIFRSIMNIITIAPDIWKRPNEPETKWTTRRTPIKYIVIHTTGGTDSRGWLSKWNRKVPTSGQNDVSIHYLVQRDGNIYQIAPDNTRAWHVGTCMMPEGETDGNGYSLGIEIEHLNEPDYPEKQLNAVAELVHELMEKYKIPGKFVISHASCARPGPNIRKVDPVNFNWTDFWDRLLKIDNPPSQSGAKYTAYSPLINTPIVDARAVAEKIATHKSPNYTPDDLRLIVGYYSKYGAQTGVDWIYALSQSIHETGWFSSWWSARPRRNPAGIGVSGQTSTTRPKDPQNWVFYKGVYRRGQSFESWDIAVQHHLARLLCYALRDDELNDQQKKFITLIDTSRLAKIRGCARQAIGLNGVWAVPGLGYSQKLADIANSLL